MFSTHLNKCIPNRMSILKGDTTLTKYKLQLIETGLLKYIKIDNNSFI